MVRDSDRPAWSPIFEQLPHHVTMRSAPSSERCLDRIARHARAEPAADSRRVKLARRLLARGAHARARRVLERALARREHDVSARVELGWLELELGDRERAEANFRRALALSQSNDAARVGLRAALKARHRLFARAVSIGCWARRPIPAACVAVAAMLVHTCVVLASDLVFDPRHGPLRGFTELPAASLFTWIVGCGWIVSGLACRRVLGRLLLAASDAVFLSWELDAPLSPAEERHAKRCLAYVVAPSVALAALLLPGHAGVLALALVLVPIPLYQGSCLRPGIVRALFATLTIVGTIALLGEVVSALFAPGARTVGVLVLAACAWTLVSLPLGSALRWREMRRA